MTIKEYGYEYDAVLDKELWDITRGKTTDQRLFDGAYCLRSGRDAIKAIAREFKPCSVLLPALACESMIRPFEQYGHKVKFYKLNEDYSININSLAFDTQQTIFLYMNYFGLTAIDDTVLEHIRRENNVVFIEDRTHDLIWNKTSEFKPDYEMASLRKWIPIPDGGLLRGKITKAFDNDTEFSTVRLKAQCMRHEYLCCGDENIKTEFRKIFSTVSDIMDNDEPSAMSAYSYCIAKETDWQKIQSIRSQNAKTLIDILSGTPYVSFIQDKPGKSDLYVAFKVQNRDEVQRRLSIKGIFNTVIWPLNDIQKETCGVAKSTVDNMLAAPCDQRYASEDMIKIGNEIVRTAADVNR